MVPLRVHKLPDFGRECAALLQQRNEEIYSGPALLFNA
jgi:hypothetical protein